MNKRIDFDNLGGLATYQETLAFMQDSYRNAFAGIAAAFGNKVIISGVNDTGLAYTDGWVFVDGELMPFVGGAKAAQIKVDEVTDTEVYEDDTVNTVYYTKRAVLAAFGGYPVSDFSRMDSVSKIYQDLVDVKKAAVPTGAIMMWSGAIADIPIGWALCDGTLGTPNLSGQFIVGYKSDDVDFNAIGKTGGEKRHVLTIPEMPSHNHSSIEGDNTSHGGSSSSTDVNARWLVSTLDTDTKHMTILNSKTGYTGGNQSHNNLPPYYTLAYIIKK